MGQGTWRMEINTTVEHESSNSMSHAPKAQCLIFEPMTTDKGDPSHAHSSTGR